MDQRMKDRLAKRRAKRAAAEEKLEANTQEIDEVQDKLAEEMAKLEEERDALINEGIGTQEFKAELKDEVKKEADRIDKNKEEAIKDIRDEYMKKIGRAKNPADKERLMTEMQAKIK